MKNSNINPLFLGLTHIGQVFSIGWSKKFGKCSVFDFDDNLIGDYRKSNFTDEEPGLKKLYNTNKKKIIVCSSAKEIKKYKNIFLTIDTPLAKDGKPDYNHIKNYIKKSLKFIGKGSNLIITSQVYCGFCDELKNSILKKRKDIKLIYMAETLIMGKALDRFINPERLIFGGDKKNTFFNHLKKFKCPVFILNYKQAEMIKMAINLFLLTSVSYANLLDLYCREFGFKFSSINHPIKLDKRIGNFSYISPSLGVSGGHLERDLFSIIKNTKNKIVKSTFQNFKALSHKRLGILENLYQFLNKKNNFEKVIWIGPSYKQDSFSILNSPFYHFKKYLSKKRKKLFVYDSFFDLKTLKVENVINTIDKKIINKSLIIVNYASLIDIRKILATSKKNKIIDIGIKDNINYKNKNIYSLLN